MLLPSVVLKTYQPVAALVLIMIHQLRGDLVAHVVITLLILGAIAHFVLAKERS